LGCRIIAKGRVGYGPVGIGQGVLGFQADGLAKLGYGFFQVTLFQQLHTGIEALLGLGQLGGVGWPWRR